MGNSTTSAKKRLVPHIAFGVSLMCGISAVAVGLLLIFFADKSRAMLGNMMGTFWLFSGIALIRRSRDDSLVKNEEENSGDVKNSQDAEHMTKEGSPKQNSADDTPLGGGGQSTAPKATSSESDPVSTS